MACFVAPAVEAIVVTIIRSNIKKKEEAALAAKPGEPGVSLGGENHIPFSRKLGWLMGLLWGGCFLLAIEHIWHGEVVPWPPFLTAMSNPADIQPMLMEIATVGVTMAVLVTAIWVVMLVVSKRLEKKAEPAAADVIAEG